MTGRVTARDVLDAGYCVKGLRSMLEQHGRDFRDFVENGIPVADLDGMDDFIVQRVVNQAKKRIVAEGDRDGR